MQRNESSDSDTASTCDSNVPNFDSSTEADTVWPALENDEEIHEEQQSIETLSTTSSLTEETVGRIERMPLVERICKYFESMEPYERVTLTSVESEIAFVFNDAESPGFAESSLNNDEQ